MRKGGKKFIIIINWILFCTVGKKQSKRKVLAKNALSYFTYLHTHVPTQRAYACYFISFSHPKSANRKKNMLRERNFDIIFRVPSLAPSDYKFIAPKIRVCLYLLLILCGRD